MKKFYTILFLIVSVISAQNNVRFEFDYAQFKFDTTSNYLEIYYSIIPSDFSLNSFEDKYRIKGKMNIMIQDNESNELVVNKNWGIEQKFPDSNSFNNSSALLGVVGFNLPLGSYNIDISVEDVNDKNNFKSYSEPLNVQPFVKNSFAISDIEFANRIVNESTNHNSIFYKNTLEVFPNPSLTFTENSPVMFYYSEIYGLSGKPETLVLTKSLFNSSKQKIYETSKNISSKNKSIVEVGVLNLKKYPTDSYTFVLSLHNPNTDEFTATSKKFFLVNPNVKPKLLAGNSNNNFLGSEFSILSFAECDELFDKSKIIATSDEIDNYSKLDSLNSKRKFLFNFWKKRDDVPETPVNEFKKIFLFRVDVANKRYRTITTPGFRTDRGRIFARLGEPDEIERYPNETDSKPYEIWYYHRIEGGVYFIFGDYTGFNNYELLHSTMRGEMQDPDWARKLRTR